MSGNHWADKLLRGLVFFIIGVLVTVGTVFVAEGCTEPKAPGAAAAGLLTMVCGAGVGYWLLSHVPIVNFCTEGIFVRNIFVTRLYPWNTIRQAGILWRLGKGTWYNQIVLLKDQGSPRKFRDKTFLLRNVGRVIAVPSYHQQMRDYVIAHYGRLDFDLSDGREERMPHGNIP